MIEIVHTNGKVTREPAKEAHKYSLVKVDAEALRVLWPTFIRPGLEAIKQPHPVRMRKSGKIIMKPAADPHSGQWLPEHVRAALDAGHMGRMFCECQLIVPVSDSKPVGFLIFRLYNDEFVNVPLSLFVWIAWSRDMAAITDVLKRELVEKRAREIGVRYVDGVTSNAAWLRRLRKYGYEMHQMIIRKRID
jgi:hypothetical protein